MEFITIWENPAYYPEVIQFWKELNVLPSEVKDEDRAKELVLLARENGKVIGVTTAFRSKIPFLNQNYFYTFRVLIHPQHRKPGLASKLTVITRDFLESLYHRKETDCIGIIAFTDKEEYKTVRTEAVWRASNLTFIGVTKEGKHLRVYYFEGARI